MDTDGDSKTKIFKTKRKNGLNFAFFIFFFFTAWVRLAFCFDNENYWVILDR